MLSCERKKPMLHRAGWLFVLTLLIGATGCVERRMVILTEPLGGSPDNRDLGAIVYDSFQGPNYGVADHYPANLILRTKLIPLRSKFTKQKKQLGLNYNYSIFNTKEVL